LQSASSAAFHKVSVFSVAIKLRYNNCNHVFFAYNAKKTKDSLTSRRRAAHASLLLYISHSICYPAEATLYFALNFLPSERREAHASLLLYISYQHFLISGRRTENASLLLYIPHKNFLTSGRHAVNVSLLLYISHKTRRQGVPAVYLLFSGQQGKF
jgi:hypothetical protein